MVSFACPHAPWSDSAAPIRCRYPLSRAIPVRSCANMLASLRLKASYRVRVCLPGSAVSISLEYLPTPSGSAFFSRCFALAMFIVVELARCGCPRGKHPCSGPPAVLNGHETVQELLLQHGVQRKLHPALRCLDTSRQSFRKESMRITLSFAFALLNILMFSLHIHVEAGLDDLHRFPHI
jgi:hypothetical protein